MASNGKDRGRAGSAAHLRLGLAGHPGEARPLLTTGQAARLLGVSVQTVRNWVARGQLMAEVRGTRTMIPQDVVLAELVRSRTHPRQVASATSDVEIPDVSAPGLPGLEDVPPRERIYWWMQRARAEGVHFPLEAYNARIPQDFLAELIDRPPQSMELPEPWTEHFRPATEDDLVRLLSGGE